MRMSSDLYLPATLRIKDACERTGALWVRDETTCSPDATLRIASAASFYARRGLRKATAATAMTAGSKSMPIEGRASTAAMPRITAPQMSTGLDRNPAAASMGGTAPAPMIATYHQC